jgi:hypothetical protein
LSNVISFSAEVNEGSTIYLEKGILLKPKFRISIFTLQCQYDTNALMPWIYTIYPETTLHQERPHYRKNPRILLYLLTKMLQSYSCTCSGMKLALETEVSVLVMEMRESRWWVVIVCDSSQ